MSPIDRIDKGIPLSVHLSCLNSLDRAGADMMLLRPRCFCLCIPVTPRFFVQNQIQNLIWETRYDRISEDMTANKPKQAIFTAMLGHCWLCLNTVAHCALLLELLLLETLGGIRYKTAKVFLPLAIAPRYPDTSTRTNTSLGIVLTVILNMVVAAVNV